MCLLIAVWKSSRVKHKVEKEDLDYIIYSCIRRSYLIGNLTPKTFACYVKGHTSTTEFDIYMS